MTQFRNNFVNCNNFDRYDKSGTNLTFVAVVDSWAPQKITILVS
jgi:hypothetical protein